MLKKIFVSFVFINCMYSLEKKNKEANKVNSSSNTLINKTKLIKYVKKNQ